MDDAAIDRLRALRQARDGGLSFHGFVARYSPELGEVPRHLRQLYDLAEETRRRPVFATISMPPRHGKSTTARNIVAWRLLRDPACLNFYSAFGLSLARDFSHKTRKLARAAGVPLASDRAEVHDWSTVFDGGLLATSVGGVITGRGCNGGVMVPDDLIKGRATAESKLQREVAWEYFTDDLLTRWERGASILVPGTRWHPDDVIGRIIAGGAPRRDWRHIKLPAVVDRHGDPVDGGANGSEFIDGEHFTLWPEAGFDLEWARRERSVGAYRWWSLFQQEPRPRGGQMFGEPARFDLSTFALDGWRLVLVLDPAGTAKTSSDWSAWGVLAIRGGGDSSEVRILAAGRAQEPIPSVIARIQRLRARYPLPLWVEGVGGFAAMPDMIRAIEPRIEVQSIPGALMKGGKMERATPLAVAWNDPGGTGRPPRLAVPLGPEWDEYIEEFRDFTGINDEHDDQVDWTAHAFNLGGRGANAPDIMLSLPVRGNPGRAPGQG